MIKTTIAILFSVACAASGADHRGLKVLVQRGSQIQGRLVGPGNRYPGAPCVPGKGQCKISSCSRVTFTCEEAVGVVTENEYGAPAIQLLHPQPKRVQILKVGRQLRSADHYARKHDREVRRAVKHAVKATTRGSYRGQQRQQYKALKHAAKAQYAADMYASKTTLGAYGRQLRSADHYARKHDREVRRAVKHAVKATTRGSYRGQQRQQYKALKHAAKAQYAADMYASKTTLGAYGLRGSQIQGRLVGPGNRYPVAPVVKATTRGSYRGQQRQQYKALKHAAKAQYAADMYAFKTGQF